MRRSRLLIVGTATAAVAAAAGYAIPAAHGSVVPVPAGAAGWQRITVPVDKGDITAVAALSDKQAWAVGYRLTSNTDAQAVALRWDGASWTQESELPQGSFPSTLAVRSASDIWAAGAGVTHWDGKTWTNARLAPDPGGRLLPEALALGDSGRVWVAGRALTGAVKTGVPAIQLWDGTTWQRQALPELGAGQLSSVVARAATDVWAVGVVYATGADASETSLVLHYDGTSWQRVASPNVGHDGTWLSGLTAPAVDDVWAVGGSAGRDGDRPVAMHWDGKRWQLSATPDVGDGRLRVVTATGTGDLVAAGGKGGVSVLLRFDRRANRWGRVPDPNIVIRGAALVPNSGGGWLVGLSKDADLQPAVFRFQP